MCPAFFVMWFETICVMKTTMTCLFFFFYPWTVIPGQLLLSQPDYQLINNSWRPIHSIKSRKTTPVENDLKYDCDSYSMKRGGMLRVSLYHVSLWVIPSLIPNLFPFDLFSKEIRSTSRGISFFRFCQLSLMISFRPINDGSKRQLFFLSNLWLSMQVLWGVQKVLRVSLSLANSFPGFDGRKKWSQETSGKERPKDRKKTEDDQS